MTQALQGFLQGLDLSCCFVCGASLESGDAYEEEDPGYQVTLTRDRLGLPWCEKHQMRGDVINYGVQTNWQEVDCHSLKVGPGLLPYLATLLFCSDEQAYLAQGSVEYLLSL